MFIKKSRSRNSGIFFVGRDLFFAVAITAAAAFTTHEMRPHFIENAVYRETEFIGQYGVRRGSSEMIYTDCQPERTDVTRPAESAGGFDGNSRHAVNRQNGFLVLVALFFEQFL